MTTTPVEPLPDPEETPVHPIEPSAPTADPDDRPVWPGEPAGPGEDPATVTR